MIRALGYLIFVLAATASGAQAQTSNRGLAASGVVASNVRHILTGVEIRAVVVGNSISGADKDGAFTEFLDRSGAIKGISGLGRYSGAWRITGDQICFYYYDLEPGDPNANKWDCNSVTLDNGNIYWSDEVDDGDPVDASLVAGNPKGL